MSDSTSVGLGVGAGFLLLLLLLILVVLAILITAAKRQRSSLSGKKGASSIPPKTKPNSTGSDGKSGGPGGSGSGKKDGPSDIPPSPDKDPLSEKTDPHHSDPSDGKEPPQSEGRSSESDEDLRIKEELKDGLQKIEEGLQRELNNNLHKTIQGINQLNDHDAQARELEEQNRKNELDGIASDLSALNPSTAELGVNNESSLKDEQALLEKKARSCLNAKDASTYYTVTLHPSVASIQEKIDAMQSGDTPSSDDGGAPDPMITRTQSALDETRELLSDDAFKMSYQNTESNLLAGLKQNSENKDISDLTKAEVAAAQTALADFIGLQIATANDNYTAIANKFSTAEAKINATFTGAVVDAAADEAALQSAEDVQTKAQTALDEFNDAHKESDGKTSLSGDEQSQKQVLVDALEAAANATHAAQEKLDNTKALSLLSTSSATVVLAYTSNVVKYQNNCIAQIECLHKRHATELKLKAACIDEGVDLSAATVDTSNETLKPLAVIYNELNKEYTHLTQEREAIEALLQSGKDKCLKLVASLEASNKALLDKESAKVPAAPDQEKQRLSDEMQKACAALEHDYEQSRTETITRLEGNITQMNDRIRDLRGSRDKHTSSIAAQQDIRKKVVDKLSSSCTEIHNRMTSADDFASLLDLDFLNGLLSSSALTASQMIDVSVFIAATSSIAKAEHDSLNCDAQIQQLSQKIAISELQIARVQNEVISSKDKATIVLNKMDAAKDLVAAQNKVQIELQTSRDSDIVQRIQDKATEFTRLNTLSTQYATSMTRKSIEKLKSELSTYKDDSVATAVRGINESVTQYTSSVATLLDDKTHNVPGSLKDLIKNIFANPADFTFPAISVEEFISFAFQDTKSSPKPLSPLQDIVNKISKSLALLNSSLSVAIQSYDDSHLSFFNALRSMMEEHISSLMRQISDAVSRSSDVLHVASIALTYASSSACKDQAAVLQQMNSEFQAVCGIHDCASPDVRESLNASHHNLIKQLHDLRTVTQTINARIDTICIGINDHKTLVTKAIQEHKAQKQKDKDLKTPPKDNEKDPSGSKDIYQDRIRIIQDLEDKISHIEDAIQKKEAAMNQKLSEKAAALTNSITTEEQKLKALQDNLVTLQHEKSIAESASTDIDAAMNAIQNTDIPALEQSLQTLQDSFANYDAELRTKQDDLSRLSTEVAQELAGAEDARSRIQSNTTLEDNKKLNELSSSITEKEALLKKFDDSSALSRKDTILNEIKSKASACATEVTALIDLNANLNTQSQALSDLENQLRETNKSISDIESQTNDKMDEESKKKQDEQKALLTTIKDEVTKKIADCNTDISGIEKDIAAQKTKFISAKDEMITLVSTLQTDEKKESDLSSAINAITDDINDPKLISENLLQAVENEIANIQANHRLLSEELTRMKDEHSTLSAKVGTEADDAKAIKESEEKIQSLKTVLDEIGSYISESKKRSTNETVNLPQSPSIADNEKLSKALQLAKEYSNLAEKIALNAQEEVKLNTTLDDKRQELKKLATDKDLATNTDTISQTNTNIANSTAALNTLKTELKSLENIMKKETKDIEDFGDAADEAYKAMRTSAQESRKVLELYVNKSTFSDTKYYADLEQEVNDLVAHANSVNVPEDLGKELGNDILKNIEDTRSLLTAKIQVLKDDISRCETEVKLLSGQDTKFSETLESSMSSINTDIAALQAQYDNRKNHLISEEKSAPTRKFDTLTPAAELVSRECSEASQKLEALQKDFNAYFSATHVYNDEFRAKISSYAWFSNDDMLENKDGVSIGEGEDEKRILPMEKEADLMQYTDETLLSRKTKDVAMITKDSILKTAHLLAKREALSRTKDTAVDTIRDAIKSKVSTMNDQKQQLTNQMNYLNYLVANPGLDVKSPPEHTHEELQQFTQSNQSSFMSKEECARTFNTLLDQLQDHASQQTDNAVALLKIATDMTKDPSNPAEKVNVDTTALLLSQVIDEIAPMLDTFNDSIGQLLAEQLLAEEEDCQKKIKSESDSNKDDISVREEAISKLELRRDSLQNMLTKFDALSQDEMRLEAEIQQKTNALQEIRQKVAAIYDQSSSPDLADMKTSCTQLETEIRTLEEKCEKIAADLTKYSAAIEQDAQGTNAEGKKTTQEKISALTEDLDRDLKQKSDDLTALKAKTTANTDTPELQEIRRKLTDAQSTQKILTNNIVAYRTALRSINRESTKEVTEAFAEKLKTAQSYEEYAKNCAELAKKCSNAAELEAIDRANMKAKIDTLNAEITSIENDVNDLVALEIETTENILLSDNKNLDKALQTSAQDATQSLTQIDQEIAQISDNVQEEALLRRAQATRKQQKLEDDRVTLQQIGKYDPELVQAYNKMCLSFNNAFPDQEKKLPLAAESTNAQTFTRQNIQHLLDTCTSILQTLSSSQIAWTLDEDALLNSDTKLTEMKQNLTSLQESLDLEENLKELLALTLQFTEKRISTLKEDQLNALNNAMAALQNSEVKCREAIDRNSIPKLTPKTLPEGGGKIEDDPNAKGTDPSEKGEDPTTETDPTDPSKKGTDPNEKGEDSTTETDPTDPSKKGTDPHQSSSKIELDPKMELDPDTHHSEGHILSRMGKENDKSKKAPNIRSYSSENNISPLSSLEPLNNEPKKKERGDKEEGVGVPLNLELPRTSSSSFVIVPEPRKENEMDLSKDGAGVTNIPPLLTPSPTGDNPKSLNDIVIITDSDITMDPLDGVQPQPHQLGTGAGVQPQPQQPGAGGAGVQPQPQQPLGTAGANNIATDHPDATSQPSGSTLSSSPPARTLEGKDDAKDSGISANISSSKIAENGASSSLPLSPL